jgi:purine-nucleoside phosphorylase
MGACTNGNYAMQYNLPGTYAPIADFDLVRRAADLCEKAGVNYKVGNIFSSDIFYDEANSGMEWAKMGVLGVEMESAALYCNAARAGKKALCICTVSDSFIYPEENTTAEERQNSFTKMMEIALELA